VHGIATPDQRLRVFVSSTLEELAGERAAAREAIESFRLAPVMFELAARPHPPRDVYTSYLELSDVFVGIYGESYGWVAPGAEISGLEEELKLGASKPQLLYVKRPAADRDPRLEELVRRIEAEGVVSYRTFTDAEELRRLLADDLALLLSERFQAPSRSTLTNLPAALDRFVGRGRELAALEELLSQARLVTVTGPGGVGKTRLALEAARRAAQGFADGAHFVSLGSISDPGLADVVLQESLGIGGSAGSPLEAVVERLRDAELLLVLDNFEHLLAAAPLVSGILESCPQVTALVTSRSLLRLRGEHELPLAPLEEAVDLFVERAREANPSLEPSTANDEAVADICRRLDGLPLAIELAAAQARVLPPTAIRDRLESFRAQQTLREAMEWSFDLLEPEEQRLFARLSVFRGGWSLPALDALYGEGDALELVISLGEKSLVTAHPLDGETRFGLLETLRAFAAEKLEASEESDAARSRHADYFLALVDEMGARLNARGEGSALAAVDREEDNIRAAFAGLLAAGDHERVGRACWSLLPYWSIRERFVEGRRWAGDALSGDLSEPTRARALVVSSVLALVGSDYLAAVSLASQALPALAELGDDPALVLAQIPLGLAQVGTGEPEAGLALLEDSRRRVEEVGSEWEAVMAQLTLAWALNAAEEEAPVELFEDVVARAGEFSYELETLALGALGRRLTLNGDYDRSKGVLADVLRRVLELRVLVGVIVYLDCAGDLAARTGDSSVAARLSGAAESLSEAVGAAIPPLVGNRAPRVKSLNEEELEAGRALDPDAAAAEALEWLRRQP
jgi:predicted ATPase